MERRIFGAEMEIIQVLWKHGAMPAREIAQIMQEQQAWTKTTTYTLLRRGIEKGTILRTEPHFLCSALVTKDETRELHTSAIVEQFCDGAPDLLIASLLGRKQNLTQEDIQHLLDLISQWEKSPER